MTINDKQHWQSLADDIDELLTGFPVRYVMESMAVAFAARPITKRELCEVVATVRLSPVAASIFGYYARR